jgi:hypothetical protein
MREKRAGLGNLFRPKQAWDDGRHGGVAERKLQSGCRQGNTVALQQRFDACPDFLRSE